MTETEWTSAVSCHPMLAYLGARAGDRKRRLFACACCQRYWNWVEGTPAARVIEVAEAFADGLATEDELRAARKNADATATQFYALYGERFEVRPYVVHMHASACAAAATPPSYRPAINTFATSAATYAAQTYANSVGERIEPVGDAWRERKRAEDAVQASVLRDIIGNPFRTVAFDPLWRTTDVVLLARGIYEERAFDRMPILADALQDAGCNSDDLLDHLRDPALVPREHPAGASGPPPVAHARGCWALDLALGKE
jgi:hypothetical protein